ncbi:HlyD family efflux transporter periplasmic adaptor subunit [Pseudohalocynthiibacter aestuariivivens]|nr:HlyD family efflux transporter periplasmic adaptor subunit [Pseudohalocynthiibacter aestuariivivens]QIE46411.1 HlyD family efflux transporter periplasmic adaptor subunit [Pseudohalocynthiibacter aestuariivivens]
MRFLRQSLTGLFLMSMTLGLLAYAGYTVFSAVQERLTKEPRVAERRERVFAVNVITATPQQITPELTVFGEVQSRRSLEIRAKAGGTLVELADAFEEGGQVRAGQVLARVDPADSQSALDRAASDVSDAQAETRDAQRGLDLARDELGAADAQAELQDRAFKRQQDLEARGVGTAAAVEVAELAAAQARATVLARRQALATAEARVDQAATGLSRAIISQKEAQRRLDDTTILAGFTGSLSDVTVVEGGLISANEKMATLIDPAALEVAFRVSTPQFARLLDPKGVLLSAPVRVTLEAFGVDLQATGIVTRASAAVGEGQTGRLVFARLDAAQGLKPGDFVTVRIDEPPLENIVRLPAAALGADGSVLALSGEDRIEAIPVTLLRRQGDDILVRSAALAGREVITQRSPLLGAGIKVRPLRRTEGVAETPAPEMLELSADRRARLIAYVEGNTDMPDALKTRLLAKLEQDRVPARMVQRLETRMGG